jgi:hypothetical protein
VSEVSWSRWADEDCVRVTDVAVGAAVRVHAGRDAGVDAARRQSMGGRTARDGRDVCFVPTFPFVDGTPYTVSIDGVRAAVLVRPRVERAATTEVVDIRPSTLEVPRNLLRFSITFSAPMREGGGAANVRLLDDGDAEIEHVLLPVEYELWDPPRRRLKVLLDPARIKRGLLGHRQLGYPLEIGASFRLVVDRAWRDARGEPLRQGATRRYLVGPDERRLVAPARWAISEPTAATLEPVHVSFDRPLDHRLVASCLQVVGPDGEPIDGTPRVGRSEQSWSLGPSRPWRAGRHLLVVDPTLEDLAGNSVARVFDRELACSDDDQGPPRMVGVAFEPLGS